MQTSIPPDVTRYAAFTRAQASAVVGLLLVVVVWLLAGALLTAPPPPRTAGGPSDKGGDVELYKVVVAGVRAGQGYYDVVGAELRSRSYPVRPAFNWRQPTYAWLLGRLPSPLVGNALLALLAIAVVVGAHRWVRASDLRARALLATVLMTVTMAGALVPDFVFLQESWAGFLIVLSVCLYALDRRAAAVAAGLAALAFRELALLPCVVALVLALHRRRWPEVGAWIAGLGLYAALMSRHFAEVSRHTRPDDLVRSWVALGGSAFLLETAKWNTLLVALPGWAVALVLPLALLGLAGWRDAGAGRAALIVFGYLAVFSVVGHAFNAYWGAIYAPLLSFGFLAAPASVRDLWRALRVRAA